MRITRTVQLETYQRILQLQNGTSEWGQLHLGTFLVGTSSVIMSRDHCSHYVVCLCVLCVTHEDDLLCHDEQYLDSHVMVCSLL